MWDGDDKPKESDDEKLLKVVRQRWQRWIDEGKDQRRRELEDLAFYEGEGQWPEEIRRQRQGQNANGNLPAVPARPCLTINKVREPVRHIVASIRQSDLGVEVVPADDFVGEDQIPDTEIELREGLIRRIQRQSEAQEARNWAADRAVKAGRGYYGLMTRFVPGKSNDQEIYYRYIYDQSKVALDPSHEMPDGSDAGWGFVDSTMAFSDYAKEYPRLADDDPNPLIDWSEENWSELTNDLPDWFEGDKETRKVKVREHWYKDYQRRELYTLPTGEILWGDELPEEYQEKSVKKLLEHRTVVDPVVKFIKTDGKNILEKTEWPSEWIPIFEVVGEAIQPFDSERRFEGAVRPSRDGNQGLNYMTSAMVETIGLAPRAPFIGVAGQFEGFEPAWDAANTRNIPRLEYNATVDSAPGQVLPPPQRQIAEPPIQAISQAIGMFDNSIKSTTGIPDPTLGNVDPSIRSGRAIKTLLEQAQRGTSSYLDNVVLTARHEARVLNSLLFPIYGRPGRIVRMMSMEGDSRPVIVGKPMVSEGEGAMQKAVPFDPMKHQQDQAKTYQLTDKADWNIAVKVSKNYDTRREAQDAQITELINSAPEALLPIIGDLAWKYADGPASKELEERFKVMLAPPVQQMINSQAQIPPQVQQQMAMMDGAIKDLQGKLQQAMQIIQTKQVENQAKLQEAQMETQSREKIALINASAQLAAVQAKVDAEDARTFVDSMENRISKQLELHMQRLDHTHEQIMQMRDHLQAKEIQPAENNGQGGPEV
jgi:hypothetical protein